MTSCLCTQRLPGIIHRQSDKDRQKEPPPTPVPPLPQPPPPTLLLIGQGPTERRSPAFGGSPGLLLARPLFAFKMFCEERIERSARIGNRFKVALSSPLTPLFGVEEGNALRRTCTSCS
ncbi:hypothetical protein BaRGS_00020770 [Batillaria attramentaria]|uniref:Uncharacterized protein n=1 Tax=Batillaria attramentaria TaxID=370345 RepID=A0ABD0KLF1_9CAEN